MPKSDSSPELARARPGGRRYPYPPEAENPDDEFPAVSSILKHKAKPSLTYWAAREVATYAVHSRDEWGNLPPELAVKLLKGIPWDKSKASAGIGTGVHNAIQYYYQDGMTLTAALAAVVADDNGLKDINLESYVLPGLKFVDERIDDILFQEVTLYNPVDRYAGTADLLAKTKDGISIVLDWKTGSGLYEEVGYQLTAYCACTEAALLDYSGTGPAISRVAVPDTTHGVAVRLGGYEYEARIIPYTEELYASFLGLRALQTWADEGREWYSSKIKSETYQSPIVTDNPYDLPSSDPDSPRPAATAGFGERTLSSAPADTVLAPSPAGMPDTAGTTVVTDHTDSALPLH